MGTAHGHGGLGLASGLHHSRALARRHSKRTRALTCTGQPADGQPLFGRDGTLPTRPERSRGDGCLAWRGGALVHERPLLLRRLPLPAYPPICCKHSAITLARTLTNGWTVRASSTRAGATEHPCDPCGPTNKGFRAFAVCRRSNAFASKWSRHCRKGIWRLALRRYRRPNRATHWHRHSPCEIAANQERHRARPRVAL